MPKITAFALERISLVTSLISTPLISAATLAWISPSFAKALEYVFGIPTSFWINLQGIYDKEMQEYKEQEEIDESEIEIVKGLKKINKICWRIKCDE